jgi:hypothetical protein
MAKKRKASEPVEGAPPPQRAQRYACQLCSYTSDRSNNGLQHQIRVHNSSAVSPFPSPPSPTDFASDPPSPVAVEAETNPPRRRLLWHSSDESEESVERPPSAAALRTDDVQQAILEDNPDSRDLELDPDDNERPDVYDDQDPEPDPAIDPMGSLDWDKLMPSHTFMMLYQQSVIA